ncbi:glucose-6-phosphate dehydrogenase [Candidatus Daviesbacteria bacterium]|nr:glucose-6-phosphate dehydrogenase [Candidatus Daviesbacteria bacterium]
MDSFVLIIFGITGNLAQIKLIPALYDIAEKGLLPKNTSIIGIARGKKNQQEIKDYFKQVLHLENRHHKHPIKNQVLEQLYNNLHYLDGYLDDPNFYIKLKKYLDDLSKDGVNCKNKIYYLATYPNLYKDIFKNLQASGLNKQTSGWVRLMIEKPIGVDEKSARELNQLLLDYYSEDQIFRLDHYLGKETLQNILTFRFSNEIFEPLISKDFIDHIQIIAAEDFGIGARGGYYDSVGALKDVGQNHLLQMLAFATMDPPSEFSNLAVTKQRNKILEKLIPIPKKLVLGQYENYKSKENVDPNSKADTFFAFKTEIDNDRFKGVPIYIRGGKKLAKTVTEIAIVFKNPANRLFKHMDSGEEPNILFYRIQPNEGIVLKILVKKPGHKSELEPNYMQYCYKQTPDNHPFPDPYERLIFDAIKGDQTFFNDAKEVETEWHFIDPLAKQKKPPIIYKEGSWGPKEADKLIEADGRSWIEPSVEFCPI